MQTYAMQTCNVTLYAIKGVMKECWRLGYLTAEEMQRACDEPKVHGTRLPVGRALDEQEMRQLLSSCRSDCRRALGARDAAAIGVLFGLGLRSHEAISLDPADYDTRAGTMRLIGKGNREREMRVPEPITAVLQAWIEVRGPWSGPLLYAVANHDRLQKGRLERRSINCILSTARHD